MMGEVREINSEWALNVADRGVDPRELEERWAAAERLLDAGDQLIQATDLLCKALDVGIEACGDIRADVARRQAEFDQALAAFRDRAVEARRYAIPDAIPTRSEVMQERRAIAAEIPGARVGKRGVKVPRRALRRWRRERGS
jgi:hypothetical protein